MIQNLTIIIPFFNGHGVLFRLIDSITPEIPIVIVDDISDEPLQRQVWMGPNVTILRLSKKGYFAGAVNAGIAATKTDVLVLNQDTWFDDCPEGCAWQDWLDEQRQTYALIGERISGEHPAFPKGYVHGTFMFMRRDAIQAVGLLNAKEYPLWGNTAEWQWRAARKGFAVLPTRVAGFNHARQHQQKYGSSIAQLLEREPDKQSWLIRTPPLVSVIVACHNYGRYLADCIHSLIGGPTSLGNHPGQTLQSFEVIIVDDASTDGSAQMVQAWADDWKGIRVYCLAENVGTARTLNFGIERAVGQYITFLSADDMREANSLEVLVQACRANEHSFVYDDIQMFGNGRRLRPWRMEDFDAQKLLTKNHIHAGILYPRQAWVDAGGYPPSMDDGREDWAFNIALAQACWCGVHVRAYGYLYRREGQNRSLTNTTPEHRMGFLAKLQRSFPHLYEGVSTMCCGDKRSSPQRSKTMAAKTAMMAAPSGANANMVRLEYMGKQQPAIWNGHVTHTPYQFGVTKRVGWVYVSDAGARDGKGFLSLRENGEDLFRVYVAPAEPVKAVVLATPLASLANAGGVLEVMGAMSGSAAGTSNVATVEAAPALVQVVNEAVDSAAVDDVASEDPMESAPDPSTLTVREVEKLTLTAAQWQAVYDMEANGLKRKSVLDRAERLAHA